MLWEFLVFQTESNKFLRGSKILMRQIYCQRQKEKDFSVVASFQ